MPKETMAAFRLDTEEWENFKQVSDTLGLNASTVLRLFVKQFIKTKDTSFLLDN